MPHIKTHLSPNVLAIDIAHKTAAIPGTGDTPVTFMYSYDVAKFVVASLDLPVWKRESRVIGETITWNQFVDLAEQILGSFTSRALGKKKMSRTDDRTEVQFDRQYDSVDKLKRYEVTELPGHVSLYEAFPKKTLQWFLSLFELWTTDGTSHVRAEGSLNEAFPEMETMSIRTMLQLWKGRV